MANVQTKASSRNAPQGKAAVLKGILAREAAGLPLNHSTVERQDPRLHADILRVFTRWDAALRAAGINPDDIRRQRRWSRQAVIDRIRQRAQRGMSLNLAAVYKDEAVLGSAADRYFASWDDALLAAGLDPCQWRRHGPKWTRDRVIAAIHELRDAGAKVNHGAVAGTVLSAVAGSLFGSWDAALRAAGLDPETTRARRKPYTRDELVKEIRRRDCQRQATSARLALPCAMRRAACRLFGSLQAAYHAAGVHMEKVRVRRKPWTADEIVEQIRRKHADDPTGSGSILLPGEARRTARRIFGSWDAALRAAGLDPNEIRQPRKVWTPEAMVKEIQRRHKAGRPVSAQEASRMGLRYPARKLFGSWDAALRAAGLDANDIHMRPIWTAKSVLKLIQRKHAAGDALNADGVSPSGLYDAARRRFGSWHAALQAAGVDPERVRIFRRPWTREDLVAEIQRLHSAGGAINSLAGSRKEMLAPAIRLFGSWDAALRAAGLDPDRIRLNRRPWTADEVTEEIRQAYATRGAVTGFSSAFHRAAGKLFGSWEAALQAAGVDQVQVNQHARRGRRT
jgi:hypothetical protein